MEGIRKKRRKHKISNGSERIRLDYAGEKKKKKRGEEMRGKHDINTEQDHNIYRQTTTINTPEQLTTFPSSPVSLCTAARWLWAA